MAKRPKELEQRLFDFALRVLKVVRAMPRTAVDMVLARQVARCATSVGANFEEARAAHTRADFIRRMNISRAEAREAHYWLRLIAADGVIPAARLKDLIVECDEIARILTASVRNARKRYSE